MGGEGPTVTFSQDRSVPELWASHTGLKLLDSHELEIVYARAKDFLLQLGTMLVNDHGWHEEPKTEVRCLSLNALFGR